MSAQWKGGRSQSNLWSISSKIEGHKDHSTQKPLECFTRPIQNHGRKGDTIYDPFLGSGTALIAAHVSQRRCVAIEINPRYVDMALQRYVDETDVSPVRERDGKEFTSLLK